MSYTVEQALDARSKRKKKEEEENKSKVEDALSARAKRLGQDVDENFVNSFFSDAYSFLKSASDESDNVGWANASSSYSKKKSELEGLSSRYSKVRGWLTTNKGSIGDDEYNRLIKDLDDIRDNMYSVESYFSDNKDYFSQWKTEDEYKFAVEHATAESRQEWYKGLESRLSELFQEKIGLSFFTDGDRIKEIDSEMSSIKDEMRQYEIGGYNQYGQFYGSKVADEYQASVTSRENFSTTSAKRDYNNPTREDLNRNDALNDSSTWYVDADGVYRDAYGNPLSVDSSGNWYNPNASQQGIPDRLGMFLSATDAEKEEAAGKPIDMEGTWESVIKDGLDGNWDQLKDSEIAVYYALLSGSQQDADKYLADMKPELNRRATMKSNGNIIAAFDDDETTILEKLALNLATVPAQAFSNIAGTIENTANTMMGKDINPYSAANSGMQFTQTVRGKQAEELDKTGFKFPVIDFTLGDIYQTGMSRLDSALATKIFRGGGTVFLGMGAAQSEAYKLYQKGASAEQITIGSFAAGAAEAIFEYLSYGKLKEIKDIDTGAKWVKSVLIQGYNELAEESLTEISNILSNALVMGNRSDLAELYKENKEAAFDTFLDLVKQVAQAGFGGFLGGIGSGMVKSTQVYSDLQAQYSRDGKRIMKSDGVDALKQLAIEVSGADSKLAQEAAKVTGETFSGDGFLKNAVAKRKNKNSLKAVGRLYNSVANEISTKDKADIAKSLEETGFRSKSANNIADAIVAYRNGEPLSNFQKFTLESVKDNKAVKNVILNTYGNMESSAAKRNIQMGLFNLYVDARSKNSPSEEGKVSRDIAVSDNGKIMNTETGNAIDIPVIAQADDGTYKLYDKNTGLVDSGNISYADNDQGVVIDSFLNLSEDFEGVNRVIASMDASSRNKLMTLYDQNQNTDGATFVNGVLDAYFYGHEGIDLSAAKEGSPISKLTEQQRSIAYEVGRAVGEKATTASQSNVETVYEKAQNILDQTGKKKGDFGASLEDGISPLQLNQKQKAVYSIADDIARGIQTNIRVYDGAGTELGFYNHETDEIMLNLNAANSGREAIMAFTMAHEIVHRSRKGSPAKYKAFSEFLLKEYGKQGADIEAMIQEQIDAAERFNKTVPKDQRITMTEDKALEEVVCDACQRMLLDTDAGRKLAEFGAQSKQNRGIVEEIKRWISDLLEKLRNFFSGVDPDSTAAKEFAKFDENAKKILADMYVDMATDSGEKLSTIKAAYGDISSVLKDNAKEISQGEIITEGAVVTDGNGKSYSIKSMKSDIAEGQMFRDLKNVCGWTQRQVNELKQNLEMLVEYMTPFRDILDMNETYGREGRRFSPYKPNSDPLYKISMDFSTLCSKRLLTQYVIENLQLRENRPMSAEEQMAIRDMLNEYRKVEKGLQVACAMCYVEAARLKAPKQMQRWLNDPEPHLRNYFAQKNKEFKATVSEAQGDFKESRGYDRNAPKKDMKQSDVKELNKIGPKMRERYQFSAEEQAIVDKAKTLPNSTYLTAGNLANLSETDPVIYDAYTSFVRTATRSKSLETDEPYYYGDSTRDNGNGIVVTDSFIDSVNKENGMRFSSWSDWRIQHMLDYITAVIDNSVRGAAMHGYTKFGDEVRVLGKTGMMFNMSGVPGSQTGLNEDGSLNFSATESIDVNEAMQLREDLPETAGLQCIGVSYDHIIAMMKSDIIDYIIPYHTSGLNADLRRMADIYGWDDYTGTQNASIDKSVKLEDAADKEHWHEEPVFSEFFVGYDTGMTGIEAMRASAERYKQMCKDRGMIPKFSQFAEEDNYWKLLIDRKMINQNTGKLIQQKPVTPTFDFDVIKSVVDKYVNNYDAGLESRALNYIVENWDSIPQRIKDLKKKGGTKNKKTSKAVNTLANQTLAAQQKSYALPKSDRDSDGNQLSDEQQEYFKDSKVRDEDGNLKVVYHGTGSEFYEFSYDFMSTHGSMEGQGFYFTDKKSMAEGYQKNGAKLLRGYLDIKKPLSDSEVTLKRSELTKLLKAIDPTGDDVVINYDPMGGIGYPSRAWYNRSLSATVDSIYNSSDSDSEILAGIANSGAGTETVVRKAREVFGYDGYIVSGKYEDATVYVAFESNQFKDSGNRNPTYNPDFRYALPKVDAVKLSDDKIKQNISDVAKLNSVYHVDKSKLERTGKKPSEIFTEYFDRIGWNIYSEDLGDIEITKKSVRDEIRHGITAEKIASTEAIPSVIRDGKVIFAGLKPGTTVYRIVVCAPITIGKTPYYMGVMLQRDANTQRLYLHNVVIEEETTTYSSAIPLATGADENNDRLFITNILQDALNVKKKLKQNGIENPSDNKYIKMVEEGATHIGEYDIVPKEAEPKKTILAWKALVVKPGARNNPKSKDYGNMYPPQVHQVASTPYGVWIYANNAPKLLDKNGEPVLTKYGRPKVKEGMTYRPAWHFGDVPYASQFRSTHGFFDDNGVRRFYMSESKGILVWALCEMAADENYQDEADMAGHVGDNRYWDEQQASLWYIPENGYYKYMTNRVDPNSVTWYLSDKMRIVQTITDAEMRDILTWVKEDGATDLEFNYPLRIGGKDVNPADYGIPVGNVVGDGIDYVDRWKNQFREIALNGEIDITQSHFYYVPSSATNYGSYETVSFSKEVDDHSQELIKTKKDAKILFINSSSKSAVIQSFEASTGVKVKDAKTLVGRKKIIEAAKTEGYDIVEFAKEAKGLGSDVVIINPDSVIRNYKFNNVSERHGRTDSVSYKLPVGEDTSPRALLANAFEGIATNDIEKRNLQEYKDKIDMLNTEEQKLSDLRAEIRELSFAKGPRDKEKISKLRFEANKTANRINTMDKILLRMEASAPLQSILEREKEMAYKKGLEKNSEKNKTARQQVIETREKRYARDKLQKLVIDTAKWLSHPAKTDVKCPDILKKPYADFLNSIDMSSKRLSKGGDPTNNDLRLTNAMNSLATSLERIMTYQDPSVDADQVLDAGYLDLPANFVRNLREMTEDIKKMMVEGDYVVNNMSAQDVRNLSKMIRTLNHAIKEASKLYANLRFANVEALADDSMTYMDSLGDLDKSGGMKDFVIWDNVLPYYAFKRFGEGGASVFEALMDAQDKLAFLSEQIFDFKDATWTDAEAKEWGNDTHSILLSNGKELTLTSADAMGIYCLTRREQGIPHLLGGGVRVIGIQKGSLKAKDSRSTLTEEDLKTIVSSLTDRQKAVADAIQKFMSTTCSEWGNEISMKRFLTKEFLEKFYYPIESNDENMETKDPTAQQSDLFRLLNISATKPLTKGANNEVIIRNIFTVFTNHASDMARLNAYGMALLDYMKWLNYRQKTVKANGNIDVVGVRKFMEKAYGASAKSYVLNLIRDINGRPSDGGDPTMLMKMMRNAKVAGVGNSLRVALLQITAYPRAAMVLSTKSLALGLTKVPQIEKAKKYCGIALWKSFGFYDTNIARSIEDQMKGETNIRQKIIELSLKGAEWGDAVTWGALWNACEYEVAKTTKNKIGSEEFNYEVGKKLREVVYSTQVVDSTLTRSQIMRSKKGMAQEAAAFMSEPTLSANILMDAGFQFYSEKRRTGSAKTAWKKTGKYIGRAVSVYSSVALFAALAESLADAWRDDDDEEFYKKFLEHLPENIIMNLLPFNKIPVISDMFEMVIASMGIGFFSSDKLSTQWLTQAKSAIDAWGDVFSGKSTATVYNALYKSVKAASYATGLPISNAMREVAALWNNTAGAYDITLKLRTYGLSNSEIGEEILEALIDGNDRQADSLKEKSGDWQSSFKSALKEKYLSGEVSSDLAIDFLIEQCDMDEEDAYWKLDEWAYQKENGSSDEYSKYTEFFDAVQTGRNLKTVIKNYTDNGVELNTLASQITSHFRPQYSQMSTSERANIKGYLLNAFEQCGVSRDDANKKLQYWEFTGDHPDTELTQYQIADYYEFAKPAKISVDIFESYCLRVKDISGEGNKEKRMAVINSLPITSAQKDALYYAEGWSASTIYEAPWRR